jgi:hypothetical protein
LPVEESERQREHKYHDDEDIVSHGDGSFDYFSS